MLNRRDFLKSAAVGGLGLVSSKAFSEAKVKASTGFFGVHPFVESHPEAVFIMRTNIDVKTNVQAIRDAGLTFGRSVFVQNPLSGKGIPLTHKIAVKPNLTCSFTSKWRNPIQSRKYPLEYGMGIITDPNFVEGTIEAMKMLGLSGNQFFIREVNCPWDFKSRGYTAMAERTGADIRDMHDEVGKISENDINWVDIPDGSIHTKLPYLQPINTHDSWLLNISKFKAHGMGLTLCCKNIQGTIARPYQQFCGRFFALNKIKKIQEKHLVRDFKERCEALYKHHVADGIPRWGKPGLLLNGITMDVWVARTLANISATPMGLCVVEGIYGRDGNGFQKGHNKGKISDNEAWDYMTNIIIFGKDPFLVDIIGHWLGGHEPGNFGLFHLALKRGMLNTFNPMDIPVYLWENGSAVLTPLTDFERTPLRTNYLQRNYNEQKEPKYHLVDEPFDYSSVKMERTNLLRHPAARVFSQLRTTRSHTGIPIEFALPDKGYVSVEILDSSFTSVSVPVEGVYKKGYHLAVWNTLEFKRGIYYCRFRFADFTDIQKFTLT